jgi:hypothetical protein
VLIFAMKQTVIFLVLLICHITYYGQVDEDEIIIPSLQSNKVYATDTTRLHSICEIMPEYLGGWYNYYAFLKANINRKNITDSTGKVFVRIIVNKHGDVESPFILKGLNKSTNDECLRVVKLLKFTPGLQHKKPVLVPLDLIIPLDPNFNSKIKSKRHNR